MSLTTHAVVETEEETWEAQLKKAYVLAQQSPDPSTQNGALLAVASDGPPGRCRALPQTFSINEFPRGVHYEPSRWERPGKYAYVEHAERNAIYAASRYGISTDGLTMVCPWAACADCARAIIQAGIATLVTHKQAGERSPASWQESIALAYGMLHEAGVEVHVVDAALGAPEVRHTGELWTP